MNSLLLYRGRGAILGSGGEVPVSGTDSWRFQKEACLSLIGGALACPLQAPGASQHDSKQQDCLLGLLSGHGLWTLLVGVAWSPLSLNWDPLLTRHRIRALGSVGRHTWPQPSAAPRPGTLPHLRG